MSNEVKGEELWDSLANAVATGFAGTRSDEVASLMSAALAEASRDPDFDEFAAQEYLQQAHVDAQMPALMAMAYEVGQQFQDELDELSATALSRVTGATLDEVAAARSDPDPSSLLSIYSSYLERS